MTLLTQLLLIVVALLHLGFMILEMLLWTRPIGRRIFRMDQQTAAATRTLAANQGLYNGLLAAALIGSLFLQQEARTVQLFLLICIIIAGIFGALTASRRILYVQALPAFLALIPLSLG